MPDQLRFLPQELSAALGGPNPVAGVTLSGIVVPELTAECQPAALPLSSEQLFKKLAENYVAPENDQAYPGWLALEFAAFEPFDPVQFTKRLCALPSHWLKFSLEDDSERSLNGLRQVLEKI